MPNWHKKFDNDFDDDSTITSYTQTISSSVTNSL